MNNQRISNIYDYKDAAGGLVFQVVRFEPKGFAQRRPYKDGFIWGLGEVEPILYRLPELIQGIQDCETIFICEGEKDADNLAALGFIATSCPMGAGKWQSTYTEALHGCCEAVVLAMRPLSLQGSKKARANEIRKIPTTMELLDFFVILPLRPDYLTITTG